MRKEHTRKSQKQNSKGRVLARELSEELHQVRGGTLTRTTDPNGIPDYD